jgi:hypothetical protein
LSKRDFSTPARVPLTRTNLIFDSLARNPFGAQPRFPRSPLVRLNSRRPRVLNRVLPSLGGHDRSAASRLSQLIVRNVPPDLANVAR